MRLSRRLATAGLHRSAIPSISRLIVIPVFLGRSQAVRQRVLIPSCAGSNPAAPATGRAARPSLSAAISRPSDSPSETNWTGVLFGFAIAAMAAFQQFKLPPILPDLLTLYSYDRVFAGGLMSIYAVIGLLASLGLAAAMMRFGPPRILTGALVFLFIGNMLGLAAPLSAAAMMTGRACEGDSQFWRSSGPSTPTATPRRATCRWPSP